MFSEVVGRLRPYLDAECVKRLKTSSVLSIDASYKVPKWIMKWGGVKLYDVLESGLNEYGEIIVQVRLQRRIGT